MFVGVDGCSSGWVYVAIEKNDITYQTGVCATLTDVWETIGASAEAILLDMPIGLGSQTPRLAEVAARQVLGNRRSSVFDTPLRPALEVGAKDQFSDKSYFAACDVNENLCGKRFSKQTWAIMPKIHQVDMFLRNNVPAQTKISESHPEVCFWALTGQPMRFKKLSGLGFYERIEALKRFFPSAFALVAETIHRYPQGVGDDDVVDALVLAVCARLGNFATLPTEVSRDDYGLPMQMVYPQIR